MQELKIIRRKEIYIYALEKEMATYNSILAGKMPWTDHTHTHTYIHICTDLTIIVIITTIANIY